jgi:hypothetical protein
MELLDNLRGAAESNILSRIKIARYFSWAITGVIIFRAHSWTIVAAVPCKGGGVNFRIRTAAA